MGRRTGALASRDMRTMLFCTFARTTAVHAQDHYPPRNGSRHVLLFAGVGFECRRSFPRTTSGWPNSTPCARRNQRTTWMRCETNP